MPASPLTTVTTGDGESWGRPRVLPGGDTDYGLQMADYRGELYGIMTATDKQLYATKFKIREGWKEFRSLPSKYLAAGRASVTVLEDRFFIVRRGTNDAVYLLWTDDFDTYYDAGRVGSQYAKTMVAPAIAAHDGELHIVGVGADNYIYHTVADSNGKRQTSWKKIDGTGTQSALDLAVFNGNLYLLHTGWNNDMFFYQTLQTDGTWSKLQSVKNNITSGLSATSWKYNELVVSYRGYDSDVKYQTFDGKKWSPKQYIPNMYMKYQTGMSTWAGRVVISFARDESKSSGYTHQFLSMNEKQGLFSSAREVSDRQWDCKWTGEKQQKSWIKGLFCL